MDRARKALRRQEAQDSEYEPLTAPDESTPLDDSTIFEVEEELPFSLIEYSIFGLLGMAMLWAWYACPQRYPPLFSLLYN